MFTAAAVAASGNNRRMSESGSFRYSAHRYHATTLLGDPRVAYKQQERDLVPKSLCIAQGHS